MYCRQERNSVASQGFTLVEILVVVVILGIAAAIVAPRVTNMGDIQAVSAARALLADLHYAQNEAVVTQEDVTVVFHADGAGYTLQKDSGTLIHPLTKRPFVVDFPSTRGLEKVRVVSASFGGDARIRYDSLGSPAQAGQVTVGVDQHRYRLTVAAVTGRTTTEAANP